MANYVSAYTGPQIDGLLSKVNPLEQSVSQKAPLAMLASSLGEGGVGLIFRYISEHYRSYFLSFWSHSYGKRSFYSLSSLFWVCLG